MATFKFQNTSYRTNGDLPPIGSHAPDLSLVTTAFQDVSLVNWQGMRKLMNIVVSIDCEFCAKSVIDFNRYAEGIDDVAMLMVSYDLPYAHKRFFDEHDLKNVIGLSAIRHAGFGENYGVQIQNGPLAGMFARAVIVLDENDTIVHREQLEDIDAEPDFAAIFRSLGISIET